MALLSGTIVSQAQVVKNNLIPNGGFGLSSKCPNDLGQIEFATGWKTNASVSPDLYAACSLSEEITTPCNSDFCKNPSGGNNYVGLIVFSVLKNKFLGRYSYGEDIWVKLKKPMKKGKKYELRMDLCVSDSVFCKYVSFMIARFSLSSPSELDWPLWYEKKGFMIKIPVVRVTPEEGWTQISIEFTAERDAAFFHFGLIRPFFTKREYKNMSKRVESEKNHIGRMCLWMK